MKCKAIDLQCVDESIEHVPEFDYIIIFLNEYGWLRSFITCRYDIR